MLTDTEKQMLDLAGKHYKYAGAQDADATRMFGISPVRYWQLVNNLLDREDAVAYAPMTVKRLRARRRQPRRAA